MLCGGSEVMRSKTDTRRITRVDFSLMSAAVRSEAIRLAKRGLPVFPCNADKSPCIPGGFHRATTNIDTVRRYWKRYPGALIGVPTGRASNLLVVDVDPEGRDWLWQNAGRLEIGRAHETKRGRHLLYRMPDRDVRCSAGALSRGIDVRAEGGYIIWWPAHGLEVHGRAMQLRPPPGWLLPLLTRSRTNHAELVSDQRADGMDSGELQIPRGQRNDFLSREAFRLRRLGASVEQIERVIQAVNQELCATSLPGEEVHRIAAGKMSVQAEGRSNDQQNAGTLELRRGSEIQMEPISWLWHGWIAAGKLHLLAGVPGTGKTTIALSLAAIVTRGGTWPDGTKYRRPSNVVIWSGEDDAADTLAPRLAAMNADLTRVHFVGGIVHGSERRQFDPAQDMPALIAKARELGDVALFVVDPVVTAIRGDSHKNAEVRRGLAPLVHLAEEQRAAVLGITHFSKGSQGREPIDRLTGSLAFGAAPRLVFAASKMKDELGGATGVLIMVRVKSNLGPDGGGFKYALETADIRGGIVASKVRWGEVMDGSAGAILAQAEGVEGRDTRYSALDEAQEFLRLQLADAPVPADVIKRLAQAAGIARATLRRAKHALGVLSKKSGMEGHWMWRLPANMLTVREDAQQ